MDRSRRHGHVSKDRLLGEGSAFTRQLAKAQEQQQQQHEVPQQLQLQPAQPDHDTGHDSEDGEHEDFAYSELWDARTIVTHIGLGLEDQQRRYREMQLPWPQQRCPVWKFHPRLADIEVLQYSDVWARSLHRQSQQQRKSKQQQSAMTPAQCRVAELLFGPSGRGMQQQRPQQNSSNPGSTGCEWHCCHVVLQTNAAADSNEDSSRPVVCGAGNDASSLRCAECGGARWDGPHGQLRARLRAALQTADLDVTTLRQVSARVAAEAGCTAGLAPPRTALNDELTAFLAEREKRRKAAAGGTAAGTKCERVLPPGCPASASGVYSKLINLLSRKQGLRPLQQQQQGNHEPQLQQHQIPVGAEVTSVIETIAAASAALAPGLLTGVQQRHGKSPGQLLDVEPVPGAIYAWICDAFDRAASQAPHSSSSDHLQPQPLHRPIPDWTLQQLLDRRSAVLRQELLDTARHSLQTLPTVEQRYELSDGEVLMQRDMSFSEWIDSTVECDTVTVRKMPIGDGASTDSDGDGRSRPRKRRRQSKDESVRVKDIIACEDWGAIQAVRQHIHHFWWTWLQLDSNAHRQHSPYRIAQAEQALQVKLLQQRQCMQRAWATAPPFQLRHVLRSICQQTDDQQRQQQPARRKRGRRKGGAEGQVQHDIGSQGQEDAEALVAGPSAAAGARRRSRQQVGNVAVAQGATTAAAVAADTGTDEKVQSSSLEQQQGEPQVATRGRKRARSLQPQEAAARLSDGTGQVPSRKTRSVSIAAIGAAAGSRESADGTSSSNDSNSSTSSSTSSSNFESSSSSEADVGSGSESEWVDSEGADDDQRIGRVKRARHSASVRTTAVAAAEQAEVNGAYTMGDIDVAGFDMFLHHVDDLLLTAQSVPHSETFRHRPGSAWQPRSQQQQPEARIQDGGKNSWVAQHRLYAGMTILLDQAAAMGITPLVLQRTVTRLEVLTSK